MPNFNRRGFMQLLGAAGTVPLIPAMPARAVIRAGGASTSKALWASIYAKSGSASKFVTVARNMGLSSGAIQGVSARSVGIRIAVASTAEPLTSAAQASPHKLPPKVASKPDAVSGARDILTDFKRTLSKIAGEVEDAGSPKAQDVTPDDPDNGAPE